MPNNLLNEPTILIPPAHVGDGLYLVDYGYNVAIAVNHHTNEVAYIDAEHIDNVISYLQKVKALHTAKGV
jgi:hypothetical protein